VGAGCRPDSQGQCCAGACDGVEATEGVREKVEASGYPFGYRYTWIRREIAAQKVPACVAGASLERFGGIPR
jgi:hypothetical protein